MKAMTPKVWLTSVAAVLGSLVVILNFWTDWGWVPNSRYNTDHVDEPTAQVILRVVEEIDTKTAAYHRHWECDEIYEEIIDLRSKQAGLTAAELAVAVEVSVDIENLTKKYDKLDCVNHTD